MAFEDDFNVGTDQYVRKTGTETIVYPIEFNPNNYGNKGAIIKDKIFEQVVEFKSVDLGIGVFFKNCEFRNGVEFVDCKASGYDHNFHYFKTSLEFNDCKINRGLIVKGKESSFENLIACIDCSWINNISFNEITCGGIHIQKTNVNDGFVSVVRNNILGRFEITECGEMSARFNTEGNNCYNYSFKKTTFKSRFELWGDTLAGTLVFNDCDFKEKLLIERVKGKSYSLIRVTVSDKTEIEFSDNEWNIGGFEQLYILDCEFKKGFYVNEQRPFLQKPPLVREINIDFNGLVSQDIIISHLDIYELKLRGVNNNNVKFKHLFFHLLSIIDFTNESHVSFINCEASKSFEKTLKPDPTGNSYPKVPFKLPTGVPFSKVNIHSSILGKTKFIEFNFKSFHSYIIKYSMISEITTLGVKWFNIKQFESFTKDPVRIKIVLEEIIDTCRQFKTAMYKQEDKIQALIFQSHEYEYYRKLQNLTKGSGDHRWEDRVIFLAGWTNEFGQSWQRALGLMCLFIIPFNFIMIGLVAAWNYNPNVCTFCEIFAYSWREFAMLLNPIHDLSKVFDDDRKLPQLLYILDFFQRLIFGFFSVQIVSGFRKYFKN